MEVSILGGTAGTPEFFDKMYQEDGLFRMIAGDFLGNGQLLNICQAKNFDGRKKIFFLLR
jgi:hypothetical protein